MTAPQRTCIGCRRTAETDELVRLVRSDDGSLAVGRTLPGRGAWLCATSPRCVDLALRRKAFGRAFRAPISDGAAESLRAYLEQRAKMGSRDMERSLRR